MRTFTIWTDLFILGVLWVTSCTGKDEMKGPWPEGQQEGITITAVCNDMVPEALMTRAAAVTPKTAQEKQINTLHLFFFDKDGQFLKPTNSDIFSSYYRLKVNEPGSEGGKQAVLTISGETFEGQNVLTDVTVYAVANIYGNEFCTQWTPGGDIVEGDRNDAKKEIEITELEDLKNWYYRPTPREDISQLPLPGMPMVGITTGVDLSRGNNTIQIDMQALMARVDVSVQLDANQTNNDGTLPKLQITEYGVRNMPYSVPFSVVQPGDSTIIPEVEGIDKDPNPYIAREKVVPYKGAVLYDGQKAATFTYYTYENVQRPIGRPDYPKGVDTTDAAVKQRWKRTIAGKNASAVVLKGEYVTHQGLEYKAEFNIYMGSNTYDNFEVRRNRCYKNNISIRGLDYVRNSDPNVYSFDGRVNVVTDNPLYLAIVNERKVDAHATALPMDVWLLLREARTPDGERPVVSHKTKVVVSIANPDETSWIRMEKVPRRDMEAGYFAAGTGARKYFTTDLVTQELAEKGKTIIIDGDEDDSRTRIYFYIDENIPQSDNAEVPDRKAYINVHYENSLGDVRDRVLEIEQRGMLRVSKRHTGYDDAPDRDKQNYDVLDNVYIEYYEEYLSHNDPLDQHLQPGAYYEGLPWGTSGKNYRTLIGGIPRFATMEVYDNGLEMTQKILGLGANNVGPISNVHLYMEQAPESAFHYCYGKNKRNTDGSVPNNAGGYWYMPGIRELERALVEHYLAFADFQGKFYWSASAAKTGIAVDQEETERARATKAIVIPGHPVDYAQSGSRDATHNYENGGGRALRRESLRIRAFYKNNR